VARAWRGRGAGVARAWRNLLIFFEVSRRFRDSDEMEQRLYALSDRIKDDQSGERGAGSKRLLRTRSLKGFPLSMDVTVPSEEETTRRRTNSAADTAAAVLKVRSSSSHL
jgi:hypothetical protein